MGEPTGAQEGPSLAREGDQARRANFKSSHNNRQIPNLSRKIIAPKEEKSPLIKRTRSFKQSGQGLQVGDCPSPGLLAESQGNGPSGAQASVYPRRDARGRQSPRTAKRILWLAQAGDGPGDRKTRGPSPGDAGGREGEARPRPPPPPHPGRQEGEHHPAHGDPRHRQPRQQAQQILRIRPLAGPLKQTIPPPGQTPNRLGPARAGLFQPHRPQRAIPLPNEAAEPSAHGGGEGLPRPGLGSLQPKGQGRQEGDHHQPDRHLLQRLQTLRPPDPPPHHGSPPPPQLNLKTLHSSTSPAGRPCHPENPFYGRSLQSHRSSPDRIGRPVTTQWA
jgi:hypothetical protein